MTVQSPKLLLCVILPPQVKVRLFCMSNTKNPMKNTEQSRNYVHIKGGITVLKCIHSLSVNCPVKDLDKVLG